jgi:hypothetical protein
MRRRKVSGTKMVRRGFLRVQEKCALVNENSCRQAFTCVHTGTETEKEEGREREREREIAFQTKLECFGYQVRGSNSENNAEVLHTS